MQIEKYPQIEKTSSLVSQHMCAPKPHNTHNALQTFNTQPNTETTKTKMFPGDPNRWRAQQGHAYCSWASICPTPFEGQSPWSGDFGV